MSKEDKIKSLEVGNRIRYLRKKLGLTRSQFEEITGMSSSTLKYFENGDRKVSLQKAKLLSNLFTFVLKLDEDEASPEFLLYGEINCADRKVK